MLISSVQTVYVTQTFGGAFNMWDGVQNTDQLKRELKRSSIETEENIEGLELISTISER